MIVVYSDGDGTTLKVFGCRKAEEGEDADAMNNVLILTSLNKAFKGAQMMEGDGTKPNSSRFFRSRLDRSRPSL